MQQKKQDSDTATRAALAGGTYPVLRRDVGAVAQQRLHHRKMPALGGVVQAGPLALESRRAVSGGATATRAASPGGDAMTDKEYACAWRGRICLEYPCTCFSARFYF